LTWAFVVFRAGEPHDPLRNHALAVASLQISKLHTMDGIDALDRGDRRAFRDWAKRWSSLTTRAESLLVKMVTAEC
jgi:hypothetical protein